MVTLIHGDNITASYNHLQDLKQTLSGQTISLEAKSLTKSELLEHLARTSLLGEEKTMILDQPASNKKLFDALILPDLSNLILYEPKKLTSAELASFQKKLPGLKVEEFKLDPLVFKFVDALRPGNQKVLIPLWRAYSETEEPEIAFSMLIRQFRLLILAKENFTTLPDDLTSLSPWQKANLQKQAALFSEVTLLKHYKALETLDYKFKTGQTPLTFTASLELFLYSL